MKGRISRSQPDELTMHEVVNVFQVNNSTLPFHQFYVLLLV